MRPSRDVAVPGITAATCGIWRRRAAALAVSEGLTGPSSLATSTVVGDSTPAGNERCRSL